MHGFCLYLVSLSFIVATYTSLLYDYNDGFPDSCSVLKIYIICMHLIANLNEECCLFEL